MQTGLDRLLIVFIKCGAEIALSFGCFEHNAPNPVFFYAGKINIALMGG